MDAREILIALRRIMRAVDQHSKKLERQVGLTVPQILVLQAVNEAGGLPINVLARRVSLSQGTVTSILDRLCAKQLLKRERDGGDRRVVTVSLTAEGSRQIRHLPGLLQEDFVSRFDALEPWEQTMLTSAVQRIAAILNAQEVDASPILQPGEIVAGAAADEGREPPP